MKLTIFTPTYNRGHLLYRLFETLNRQSVKDFEWIIVDDASSDNTKEIVNDFCSDDHEFTIFYYRQEHGGKHRAINYALSKAKGEFFFIVDSDDYLTDNAVELILKWIDDIEDCTHLAGVAGLRVSESGKVWGIKSNEEISSRWGTYVEASNFEREKNKLVGDKAEVYKTKIMKQFLFPEFEGEYFVTEAVCWDAIAHAGYKLRWYYEPIYICEYLEDGLTKNGANELKGRINNYLGYCYFIRQSLNIVPIKERMVRFRAFNKTRNAMNKTLKEAAKDIGLSPLAYIYYLCILMPFVYFIRLIDKLI